MVSIKMKNSSCVKYGYDHSSNNNSLIFAVGSLTVKHMIVDIAITKIPVAAKRLFACTGCVFAARHLTLPAPPKRLGVARHACAASGINE
jgi:hypothetical protein